MPFLDPWSKADKEIAPGIKIRTAWGEKIMVSFVDFAPNSSVPKHSHPHEQMGIVLKGEIEFVIDTEHKTLKEGGTYLIPSNVEHSARSSGEEALALDIFSPPREDYK
jgi:quercetin dioxygenase-like cupin family protein